VVYGDGLQALDYVYVDDAIEATCRALEAPLSGELFNVGSGVATSVRELIELLVRVSGRDVAIETGPADWTHGSERTGNVDKVAKLLDWRARTSLEQGLGATLRWLQGTG
jgi:UDP-glucose 4-epimerase